MKTHKIKPLFYQFCLFVGFFIISTCQADYEIRWSVFNGGGGTSSGGVYTLTGTTGEYDPGIYSGGTYDLVGVFLPGSPQCVVDFHHFARFSLYWLQSGTDLPADLYEDDVINTDDLLEFTSWWLCTCPSDWPLK